MKYIINILILLALVALIVLKLKGNKEIVDDRVFHFNREQPIHVLTSTLSLQSASEADQITGNFMPNRNTQVNSEMQGKIVSIRFEEGDRIRKGQVLIQLDKSMLELQLQALDVKVEGLNTDIQRFRTLVEADAIQAVKLEKAELGLKATNAQRQTILEQIKKTTVYAPFSGVVIKKMAEIGSFAAPGRPLLLMSDIDRLKFTVTVPESELGQFKLKNTYPITVDAYPDLKITGKAIMIASQGNGSNTYPVQFEVKNTKDQKIKAGMFGKLVMHETTGDKSIIIPASAIAGSNKAPKVYLVKDGKAVLHAIVISRRFGDKAVVASGLAEGDQIVTSGFINLYDGANIATK